MSEVEDRAVDWVLSRERDAGRVPRDTRLDRSAPTDIDSPPRLIEVKAVGGSARGSFLWLERRQYAAAREQPDRFHLYVVENVNQGSTGMRLHDLHGKRLERLVANAREVVHYELPWPVADYDSGDT